ncbi:MULTISPECIES: hypothetical protein [Streptomyces]|uniref:Secreted protein n=1 Tax=Streptomyces olivaceoviridis TaxID=1921 RepID=A0ABW7VBU9_STROI|nr:hypothetical protein [Streptomyces corchorusii]AEY85887.1 hypothetical protein SHJG_0610 [Streptomyces hygroscopicus subsp. jinggangensis 5008]AGF60109.1 hypothetical protein SHJGH_0443 [Streptomyces hygroscopicus subsp. jinggangensis TL01]ALO99441.1 hypothetical protein SHL15_8496 [Streptomyces hygroscopicus subsp. limoneus]
MRTLAALFLVAAALLSVGSPLAGALPHDVTGTQVTLAAGSPDDDDLPLCC